MRESLEPPAHRLELLESSSPGLPPEPARRRLGSQSGDLLGDRTVVAGEGLPPVGWRQGIEQSDANEQVIPGAGRRRRRPEPPLELTAAGGRDPVAVAPGAPAGT